MLLIIVPVHNTPVKLFERACYSIKAQTKPVLSVVIDDCSEIKYSNEYKTICSNLNIEYIRLDKNVGPGLARQYALDNCFLSADYISFLDADDVLFPHFSSILLPEIIKKDLDVIGGIVIREGNNYISSRVLPINNITWLHGKIFKRKFLKEKNIHFSEDLFFNEDCFFNSLVYLSTQKRGYVDKEVMIWVNNKDSVTRQENSWKVHNIGFILCSLKLVLISYAKKDYMFMLNQFINLYNYFEDYYLCFPKTKKALLDLYIDAIPKEIFNKIKELLDDNVTRDKIASQIKNYSYDKNCFYKENFVLWLKKLEKNKSKKRYLKLFEKEKLWGKYGFKELKIV